MVKTVKFTDFTKNISRLRSSSTRTQPRMPIHEQTLAPNEIVDDEATVGSEDDGWDQEERDGIMYMTRRE
jgi:hypothetical protein